MSNVHIVLPKFGNDDRILPRKAQALADRTGWTLSPKPDKAADLNYFFPYLAYEPVDTLTAAYFTHREGKNRQAKADDWDRVAARVDLRVTSSRHNLPFLEPFGPTAIAVPPLDRRKFRPAPHPVTHARPVVGTSGYVYPGGRKGEGMIAAVRDGSVGRSVDWIASGRGWPIPTKGYLWSEMQKFYQGLDVYVCTSLLEGVGYGPLEALACFPAETIVDAPDILHVMMRRYTGVMVTFVTDRGNVTATADHPFWVIGQGWVGARALLPGMQVVYNISDGRQAFHGRRIGDLVSAIFRGGATERDWAATRRTVEACHILESQEGWAEADCSATCATSSLLAGSRDVGIYRGPGRWRGLGNDPTISTRQMATGVGNHQYLGCDDGMAICRPQRAIQSSGEAISNGESRSSLRLSNSWVEPFTLLPFFASLSGGEAATTPSIDGIYRIAALATSLGEADIQAIGNHRGNPSIESQTIRSIQTSGVCNLPVYNLTTASSHYWANGYLVHNCGVPVVIPRGVGMFDELGEAPGICRYEAGDVAGLERALANALGVEPDRELLRQATAMFTAERWASDHEAAFSGLLAPMVTEAEELLPDWHGNSGLYVVAFGEPARRCAKICIETFKRHMPGIPVMLCAERALGPEDMLVVQPDTDIGARAAKIKVYELAPAEWRYVLYLDADTETIAPIKPFFQWLQDGYELVICKNPQRFHLAANMGRKDNTDECQKTFDLWGTDQMMQWAGGVFSFRRCPATKRLFDRWLAEWEVYGKRDQGALLRALWHVPVRAMWLGNEWNLVEVYDSREKCAGILHHPMTARRWSGIVFGRSDSPEAWQSVQRWGQRNLAAKR